ncbi:glycosyltransferase family 9 protein [Streptosporangium sp. KLBMP 9127]|nr:glycosyltransferase family 9 protein [Streptosporangium sp. KLBMP 9127]
MHVFGEPYPGTHALVLRASGLGGLLTALPALRALHRSGQQIVLAAPAELIDVAPLTGAVKALLPTRAGEVTGPTGWKGDLTVNLQDADPRTHRMLLDLPASDMWGYGTPDGPRWDDDEDDVQRWCRLMEWYGVPADPGDTALPVPLCASPAYRSVVIHPGGWPEHRFALVADLLSTKGLRVVVTGERRDRAPATRIAAQGFLPAHAVLAGRTSLRGLCALVASARLVVSGNAALTRLAASYGTPSVVVTGLDVDEALDEARMALAGYEGQGPGYRVRMPANRRRGT